MMKFNYFHKIENEVAIIPISAIIMTALKQTASKKALVCWILNVRKTQQEWIIIVFNMMMMMKLCPLPLPSPFTSHLKNDAICWVCLQPDPRPIPNSIKDWDFVKSILKDFFFLSRTSSDSLEGSWDEFIFDILHAQRKMYYNIIERFSNEFISVTR